MNIMVFNLFSDNSIFWRFLANFWVIIVYVAIIYDFIKNNSLDEFLGPLIAIYIAVLAIYASDKEFERWYHLHGKRHPGELFVIVWSILILGIMIIDFILDKPYKIPSEVISAYIAVLGILAITKKSKSLYIENVGI